MSGPVPDGGGRGGGGFDNDPTLVVQPSSPFALGNVSSTVPTDFVVTLRNQGSNLPITVSAINFSDPQFTCTDVLPFTFNSIRTLHLRITPVGTGAKSVTLTINNDSSNPQVHYTITATALDPFAGGIVQVIPFDANLPVGQMPTTVVDTLNGTSVGVKNVGTAAFNVTVASITSGGPQFALSPTVGLPVLINPGVTVFFPIVFAPDDIGVFNGNLRFTTDLLAPQNIINAALSGLSVPFLAVSILNNANRVILIGFDGGELKFPQPNVYNYADHDSVLDFNGTLWNAPGQEKTIERLQIFYENLGVCTQLKFDLTVLRPSIDPDHFDVVTKTISLGTTTADSTDRSTFVDITASGEIIFLSITRVKDTGPLALTAIIPHFADRGEKVESV